MKIAFWWIGRTNENYLEAGLNIYLKRLQHYTNYEIHVFKESKQRDVEKLKVEEGESVLKKIDQRDFLVLCDEKGKQMGSTALAQHLESWRMLPGIKSIVFLICGAFGASEDVRKRADFTLSLSKLTFSHQMVRLFLLEQIYRSFTIIRNEKYHNN